MEQSRLSFDLGDAVARHDGSEDFLAQPAISLRCIQLSEGKRNVSLILSHNAPRIV